MSSPKEKKLQQKLDIANILQSAFGDQKPDEMNYGEIKKVIEKYRESKKETMSKSEKELVHSILVSPQAKLKEYIKEAFQ